MKVSSLSDPINSKFSSWQGPAYVAEGRETNDSIYCLEENKIFCKAHLTCSSEDPIIMALTVCLQERVDGVIKDTVIKRECSILRSPITNLRDGDIDISTFVPLRC